MTYGADDQDLQDRHFGEQGARLTYGSYLRVAELLDQQHLESDPPAHDELLFITIHQVYELWFKQLLHELTATREEMFSGDLWRARHLLEPGGRDRGRADPADRGARDDDPAGLPGVPGPARAGQRASRACSSASWSSSPAPRTRATSSGSAG